MTIATALKAASYTGVAIGSALATMWAGASGLNRKVDEVLARLVTVESDLRVLKCHAGFRENCPAQKPGP